jgi:quinohemoprotein ethanol dehydrogenase
LEIAAGAADYTIYCGRCHGAGATSGGVVPDLRYSNFINDDSWFKVVLEGALADGGMASFGGVLNPARAQAIRVYIISEAQRAAGRPTNSQLQP